MGEKLLSGEKHLTSVGLRAKYIKQIRLSGVFHLTAKT
jgi:hypothetical protein